MLLDQLRDYYGMPDQEQSEFITKRTQGMSEIDQNDVYQKIIENRSKRFGFPDISGRNAWNAEPSTPEQCRCVRSATTKAWNAEPGNIKPARHQCL